MNEAEELTSRDEVIKFLESEWSEDNPYVNDYLKEVEKFKKLVVSLDIKPSFFNIGLFSEYHDIVKKDWVRPCFYIPNGAGTPNQLLWEVFKPALEKIKGDGEEFFNLLIGYYDDKYNIKVFPEEELYPTKDEFFK